MRPDDRPPAVVIICLPVSFLTGAAGGLWPVLLQNKRAKEMGKESGDEGGDGGSSSDVGGQDSSVDVERPESFR